MRETEELVREAETRPEYVRIMPLSENQQIFVDDAECHGLEVDYSYSGRGMYGKCCPAVRVDYRDEFDEECTEAAFSVDNMGLGWVVYARF